MRIELDGDNPSGATAVEDDSSFQALAVTQALTLELTENAAESVYSAIDG